jgi:phage repressor protein C with HTH and peptisase S24 domain
MTKFKTDAARGARIVAARERARLTQEQLANRITELKKSSVSRGAIGNWERGYGLTSENLSLLASVLNVSSEWLLTGKGGSGWDANEHLGNTPDLPDTQPERIRIDIPEYDVRASMGDGFHIDRETVKDHWPFSRAYLEGELRLNPRNLVVIEVVGDSMAPTLQSGDRVLVDMSDTRVGIPGIFVLWDGDGTVAKRLEMIPNTDPPMLKRISENPHHGTYDVLAELTHIVGRVVWFARRM